MPRVWTPSELAHNAKLAKEGKIVNDCSGTLVDSGEAGSCGEFQVTPNGLPCCRANGGSCSRETPKPTKIVQTPAGSCGR